MFIDFFSCGYSARQNIRPIHKAVEFTANDMYKAFQQALELEKQQIIDAYQWGRTDQNSKEKKWYNRNARIYYSETYKKPESDGK